MKVTLTREQYNNLENALLDADAILGARPSYSGRGMSGEECLGFVVIDGTAVGFGIQLATTIKELNEYSEDEIDITDFYDAATDIMGLSQIVYWPHISVES